MTKKKLSVAYLAPGWPLNQFPNGIVTYVQNIIAGLKDDANVYVIAREVIGDSNNMVINLADFATKQSLAYKLNNKILSKLTISYAKNKLNQRKFLSIAKQIKSALDLSEVTTDLIEVEESFGLAQWLAPQIDQPIITRLHGPWFIHGPILKLDQQDNYLQRVKAEEHGILTSHGITAPSLDVLNRVREYYDCLLPYAMVIPNPVQPVPEHLQWQYFPESVPTILVVGRFDLHKGGDLAIDAFRLIAQRHKDVELKFVGPGRGVEIVDKLYSFPQYLEAFVPENEIRDRIHFFGHCDNQKISQLRRQATVTMITSRYDNFPMSLLESLATGSPVVGTAVGGIKEIIVNGFNGLLADAGSPESIAEKVLKLLYDSEKMKFLSKNAIADSKSRFSPEIVAKQTVEFYQSVLDRI